MFKNYEDILTFDELCEALRISPSYAYRLLRSNKIKSYKDGKSWKIKKDSLIEYVNNREQTQGLS